MNKRNPRDSAGATKGAIEYVCNVLAFYGIRYLNPEVFRQAKLGNSEVVIIKSVRKIMNWIVSSYCTSSKGI